MTDPAVWLRLLVAVILGSLVGLEREIAGQPAGLRTYSLVSLGSALFTIIGFGYFQGPVRELVPPGDAVRIVGALATGIGFLGAGAIVRSSGGYVQGLTTAAALWATAGVGLAVGSGFLLLAVVAVALMLIVLWGFERLKNLLHLESRGEDSDSNGSPGPPW